MLLIVKYRINNIVAVILVGDLHSMRKYILMLIALFVLGASDSSAKRLTRGYRGFFDMNATCKFSKQNGDYVSVFSLLGFSTTHGYQIDDRFFVGVGTGIVAVVPEGHNLGIEFPIYILGRYDWNIGKVPMFADLKSGTYFNALYSWDPVYINPSIGIKWTMSQKIALNIGIGMSVHCINIIGNDRWHLLPSAKLGIEF